MVKLIICNPLSPRTKNLLEACQLAILTIISGWWAFSAYKKFVSEQLTTYAFYTKGDQDGNGIRFPQVTICKEWGWTSEVFPDFPMLGPCANNSHEFFQAIENCLINYPDFDLTQLIFDTKNLNHSHVILEPNFIRVKNTYHHLEDEIWSITYHETFGPCHRADLTKSKVHQSSKVGDHIYVGFAFVTNVSWALSRIFLHSEDNFQDSAQLNPNYFIFTPQLSKSEWLDFKLTKINVSREPTDASPCQPHHKETCEEIKANERIAKELKCQVPLLNTGNHLDHLNLAELPVCNNIETRQSLKIFRESKCGDGLVCTRTKFHVNVETYPQPDNDPLQEHFGFWMTFEDKDVCQEISKVEYEVLNMLGDVGGIMGITIGFSIHMISSVCLGFLYKNLVKLLNVSK